MATRGRPVEYGEETAAEVLRLVDRGVPYREVAMRLGITLGKVQRVVWRYRTRTR